MSQLLPVPDALAAILNTVTRAPIIYTPLDEALGLVLAETVVSEIDSPPFDKSLMDGYALRWQDFQAAAQTIPARLELGVVEEVAAGRVPTKSIGPGQAIRVMTGA